MQRGAGAAALAVAEAVRELNHTTIAGRGYAWPADVDTVIGQLELAAGRLRQALEQANSWLQVAHQHGGIGHDAGLEARQVMDRLSREFECACRAADRLRADLNVVREDTSHLTAEVSCSSSEHPSLS